MVWRYGPAMAGIQTRARTAPSGPPPSAPSADFLKAFQRALGARRLAPAETEFAQQLVQHCAEDEVEGLGRGDLAALAADFWPFADRRRGAGPIVRLTAAKGETGR